MEIDDMETGIKNIGKSVITLGEIKINKKGRPLRC